MPSFKQIGIVISMLGLLGVVFQQSISKQNESKVAENSGKNLQRRKLNDDQEDIWGDDIDDAFNLTGEGEFKNGFDEGYLNTAGNIEEQYEHISDYCDEGTMETDANGSGLRGTQCNYHEASMTRHKDAIDGYNAKIVAAEAQHNCCSGEAPEACQNDFGGCGATALTTTQDAVNEAVKEIGLAKIDLEKARALLQQEALELFCACETSKYNNDNSHTVSANGVQTTEYQCDTNSTHYKEYEEDDESIANEFADTDDFNYTGDLELPVDTMETSVGDR